MVRRSTLQPVIEVDTDATDKTPTGQTIETFLERYPTGGRRVNPVERASAMLTGFVRTIRDGQKTRGFSALPRDWEAAIRSVLVVLAEVIDDNKTMTTTKNTSTSTDPAEPLTCVEESELDLVGGPEERGAEGDKEVVAEPPNMEAMPPIPPPAVPLPPGISMNELALTLHMAEIISEANTELLRKMDSLTKLAKAIATGQQPHDIGTTTDLASEQEQTPDIPPTTTDIPQMTDDATTSAKTGLETKRSKKNKKKNTKTSTQQNGTDTERKKDNKNANGQTQIKDKSHEPEAEWTKVMSKQAKRRARKQQRKQEAAVIAAAQLQKPQPEQQQPPREQQSPKRSSRQPDALEVETTRLICTNIPPSCSNEEIATDLSAALGVTLYAEQISTAKSSYGTLVAFFGCPEAAVTDAVLQNQHVIGFSRCCRLKKVEAKRQCYRCYEYGHIASHCRGKDRSSKCHRCAEPKHTGQCVKERKCLVCKGPEAIGHSFGQRQCRQVGDVVPSRPNRRA
ncbi:uncharacterized protein LOC118508416 [Anopheles stephensi]|uniref:uncharacterized protein LOC118508416 n=1 Tax=Anopheles stephensi TaxID=30069 RepID=UPI00165888C0|nr:uncharacterized protein LOC118508416 [Anopheles stephensi]